MCGIAVFLNKTGSEAVGCTILTMLNAVGCRGPDSAGVAVFGTATRDGFVIRVKLGEDGGLEECGEDALGFAGFVKPVVADQLELRATLSQQLDLAGAHAGHELRDNIAKEVRTHGVGGGQPARSHAASAFLWTGQHDACAPPRGFHGRRNAARCRPVDEEVASQALHTLLRLCRRSHRPNREKFVSR